MFDNDFGFPMNFHAYVTRGIIWGQRLVFSRLLREFSTHRPMRYDFVGQDANDSIRNLLSAGNPCFIARFGSVELDAVLRGWDISRDGCRLMKAFRLFTGGFGPFWWDNSIKANMLRTTGVFPADEEVLMHFSRRTLEDSRQLDILGSWNAREQQLANEFFPNAKGVPLNDLVPFFFSSPWSSALRGKRVLVVNPFCKSIDYQYARRDLLFADKTVLPEFHLITYRPVTSFLGIETPFKDWFEALEKMSGDIAKIDFDVAILGCGAYAFSLGAFIKRDLGKCAVHLGGATQLLFGIRGGRWDSWPDYNIYFNDSWIRPNKSERPSNYKLHEGGAYW